MSAGLRRQRESESGERGLRQKDARKDAQMVSCLPPSLKPKAPEDTAWVLCVQRHPHHHHLPQVCTLYKCHQILEDPVSPGKDFGVHLEVMGGSLDSTVKAGASLPGSEFSKYLPGCSLKKESELGKNLRERQFRQLQ